MSAIATLAEKIAAHGISHAYGIPGSGPSLKLINELENNGVTFVTTHFEGSAALMAGAAGRLSGKAGLAISIKGPGLANMVPGLAACFLDALPMVAIAESYTPETPLSVAHKRLDHDNLTKAVTKGRRFISEHGPGFDEMASWAESETPGPVLFNISGTPVVSDKPIPKIPVTQPCNIANRISQAQRPIVIAGTYAIRSGLEAVLGSLNIPVFSTAAAKGILNETLPHAAGVYTGVGLELTPENKLLPEADLVVGIGLRSNEVLTAGNLQCAAVNIDPLGDIAAPGFSYTDAGLAGLDALSTKSWGLDILAECLASLETHLMSRPFLPARVFKTFQRHFGTDVRMVLDTGNFCTIGEHVWHCARPNLYLSSGQGRYMGTALPMAIAAALHDRSVPTIASMGDGGVGMFFAELKLAVIHNLPLIIAFMSDGGFSSIRGGARSQGLSEKSLIMAQPSFRAAAEGLGLRAEKITDETALETTLESWTSTDGPLFLEITYDAEDAQNKLKGIR